MTSVSLREQHATATRERILGAVADLLERADAEELTMPAVAEASGVSLRTIYRYYPTREELLEAAGRWIGDELLKHPYPRHLDEVADLYQEGALDFDARPGLVRALALSQLGQHVRGYRRRERLGAIGRALRAELTELSEDELRRAEADGAFFCFEASSSPGFGPPLHRHAYKELFYVLEGEYEFTVELDDELRTIRGKPGTTVSVDSELAHTFRNAGDAQGRLLFVHIPAALEEFFEEYGIPVSRHGELPEGVEPPDFAAMAAALERNGVTVLASPEAVQ